MTFLRDFIYFPFIIVGLLIASLGIVALLRNLGIVPQIWRIYWPVALIIIGIAIPVMAVRFFSYLKRITKFME